MRRFYTYPESFLVEVLDSIKENFELVDAVDAVDTTILTKILVNNQAAQLASWAAIGSAITTELNANISEIDLTACKLSAYIPVSMDMIQAGAEFVATYVMKILVEAVGCGLEAAIVSGTGYNQPAGMDRDVSTFTANVGYAQKEAVALSDLSPATVGSLFATFAVDGNGRERNIDELLFVCSPATYYGKVYPAIYDALFHETRTALPIRFIKSTQVSANKAVIGVCISVDGLLPLFERWLIGNLKIVIDLRHDINRDGTGNRQSVDDGFVDVTGKNDLLPCLDRGHDHGDNAAGSSVD